jgi:beta-N-acetylhexosaminidase
MLLIAVDHEAGASSAFATASARSRRCARLGELWDRDVRAGARGSVRIGRTIADELRQHGVDFSFTPVLDVDHGTSAGDRSTVPSSQSERDRSSGLGVCHDGLRAGGMARVGKHFPDTARRRRFAYGPAQSTSAPLAALVARRSGAVRRAHPRGLEAIMPAHVVYPAIDAHPAGYSRKWLQEILRGRLGFDGLIFSDDLGMAGRARRRRSRCQS